MHRNFTPFARRVRQFRHLSKKVNRLLDSGRFQQLEESRQRNLIAKLRALYRKLSLVFSARQLRGALAGAALLLGAGMAQAQTFGPQVVAPFNFNGAFFKDYPGFVDIDGDGDQDLFMNADSIGSGSGTMEGTHLYFYENIGTIEAPDFSALADPFGVDDAKGTTPVFVDIDDDGDFDLFMPQAYYGSILFRENTGTPTSPSFGPTQTNPFGLGSLLLFPAITFVDIDDDGDFDMFATEFYGVTRFYKNTGTPSEPNFAPSINNPYGITPPSYAVTRGIAFSDLDDDGDFDLLYHDLNADYDNSAVFFRENTGTPSAPVFAAPVQEPFGIFINGAYSLYPVFVDMDNDGDKDLFFGGYLYPNGLYFYENLSSTNALPISNSTEVIAQENIPYAFSTADFPFNDADAGDMFEGIRITGLTSVGSLTYDGNAAAANQEIAAADLGLLVFTPNANEFGSNYDSFSFQVYDGTAYSANSFTMTIDVEENTATTENILQVKTLLSPNPASTELRLTMTFEENPGDLRVSIVNALGQEMQSTVWEAAQLSLQTTLDVTDLTPGMYFVQLRAGKRVQTLRFVKK